MPPTVFSRWTPPKLQVFWRKRQKPRKQASLNFTKPLTTLTVPSQTRSGLAKKRSWNERHRLQRLGLRKLQPELLELGQQVRVLGCRLHHTFTALEIRPGNSQLLHLVNQCRALQAKFRGGTFRPAHHPTDVFKRPQNQSSFGVPQSSGRLGARSRSEGQILGSFWRQWIGKHATVRKDHGAFNQVLQLA